MPKKHLISTLESLREELTRAEAPDAETSALLAEVQRDIRRLVAGDELESERHSPLSDQLEAMAARLEAGHPNLALAARQVIGALSAMGI